MQANPRYAGKPLLRLLECYVLWAIDALPAQEAAALVDMTPKLRSVYGSNGNWQQIIAGTVGMPDDMPKHLKAMWEKNQEIARQQAVALAPQEFAEMVVDENFAD